MIQQETPHALMGRVGSTIMSSIFAAQITGLVLSGLLTQYMGVRHVFALCAVLLVVLIAAGKLFMEPKEKAATQSCQNGNGNTMDRKEHISFFRTLALADMIVAATALEYDLTVRDR